MHYLNTSFLTRVIGLLIFILPGAAFATAQIPDDLVIDGKRHAIFTEPLRLYLENNKQAAEILRKEISNTCSASWRGYRGFWQITDNKLYLIKLEVDPCDNQPDLIPLSKLFPDSKGPVHAHWFSGKLIIPQGKMVEYVHMGYGSKYESYLVISIEQGKITASKIVKNRPDH
ncbi:MAG: hypothetical protein OEZ39_17735 [Gammaproteobacteria bacterium]|nr:hypothetical protein [Gammaproteobacteria bacterium]MDH5653707.1 hypothetical protein [Gammaproteobacteria bacterium]